VAALAERDNLWALYKQQRDMTAREKLIIRHAPLVKYVAGRLALRLPASVDIDDLISYGTLGLIDAIEKFNPNLNVKFETYAIARVKGSMLDGLRALDWVPHSLRQKARELERVYAKVESTLGRAATDEEIAIELGVAVPNLQQLITDIGRTNIVSLDDLWGESDGGGTVRALDLIEDENAENPQINVEFADRKRMLAEAIGKLPERERLMVTLYYYEGLTVKEIAAIMGVSQSRISQLHSKAILRLRGRLSRMKNQLL
jgi:RNA polymerase sigma factor for flagellar operon FliA